MDIFLFLTRQSLLAYRCESTFHSIKGESLQISTSTVSLVQDLQREQETL